MAKNEPNDTEAQATKIARGTQKKGQTKEQTKLITQGIEKGIAEYKKQQKAKARERDKERKKTLKTKDKETCIDTENTQSESKPLLPWVLLVLSWCGFIAYIALG